jgi:hypothetical protein
MLKLKQALGGKSRMEDSLFKDSGAIRLSTSRDVVPLKKKQQKESDA